MNILKALITGRTGGLSRYFQSPYTQPPDRNTEEWFKAFGKSPRLSPVNKIATDLAAAPGKLFRYYTDGEREEVTDHPFLDFLETPNPYQGITRSALWRVMEVMGLLKGDQYAVIERGRGNAPVELWPVPPHWVAEVPSQIKPYYVIRANNGLQKDIPIEDMFVIRDLDPLNPYARGLGVAEGIADEVETDEFMAKYAKAFFFNSATPPTIITMPGSTDEDEKRFRVGWDALHGGVQNAHRLGILNREATVIKATETAKEMDFVQSRNTLRDMCIAHFSIPPEIMGVVENSNRASITQAKIIYAENVLKPRLLARQDAINAQLLPGWGSDLLYEYDDIVPQDEEFRLQISNDGLSRGALLVNEWRSENGFDEVEGGDVFLYPASLIPVTLEELKGLRIPTPTPQHVPTPPIGADGSSATSGNEQIPPLEGAAQEVQVASDVSLNGAQITSLVQIVGAVNAGELSRDSAIEIITSSFPFDEARARRIIGDAAAQPPEALSKAWKPKRMDALRRAADKTLVAAERTYERQIERFLHEQLGRIMTALQSEKKAEGDSWLAATIAQIADRQDPKMIRAVIMSSLDSLMDWDTETVRLEAILRPMIEDSFSAGIELAESMGIQAVRAPTLTERMRQSGFSHFTRVEEITETTRKELAESIAQGIEAGEGTATLAKRVQERMPDIQAERARTIASTEAHASISAGNMDQMQRAGIEEKVWVTVGDNDVRDTHANINGERRPINQPFSNGLMFPGDPSGPPAEIIRCRCTMMAADFMD